MVNEAARSRGGRALYSAELGSSKKPENNNFLQHGSNVFTLTPHPKPAFSIARTILRRYHNT